MENGVLEKNYLKILFHPAIFVVLSCYVIIVTFRIKQEDIKSTGNLQEICKP